MAEPGAFSNVPREWYTGGRLLYAADQTAGATTRVTLNTAAVSDGEGALTERNFLVKTLNLNFVMMLGDAVAAEMEAHHKVTSPAIPPMVHTKDSLTSAVHMVFPYAGASLHDITDMQNKHFGGATPGERAACGVAMAKYVTKALLLALSAVHAAGYVHSDIKPQQLVVNPQEDEVPCKMVDLGSRRNPYLPSLEQQQQHPPAPFTPPGANSRFPFWDPWLAFNAIRGTNSYESGPLWGLLPQAFRDWLGRGLDMETDRRAGIAELARMPWAAEALGQDGLAIVLANEQRADAAEAAAIACAAVDRASLLLPCLRRHS